VVQVLRTARRNLRPRVGAPHDLVSPLLDVLA
jgi:hypothetical protein